MTDNRLDELLALEGVKSAEIELLDRGAKLQYLKYHHGKSWGKSYILFIGFPEDSLKALSEFAGSHHLVTRKQLSADLNFICIGPTADPKRIQKAMNYCPLIINQNEFEEIFNTSL